MQNWRQKKYKISEWGGGGGVIGTSRVDMISRARKANKADACKRV